MIRIENVDARKSHVNYWLLDFIEIKCRGTEPQAIADQATLSEMGFKVELLKSLWEPAMFNWQEYAQLDISCIHEPHRVWLDYSQIIHGFYSWYFHPKSRNNALLFKLQRQV